MSQLARRLVLCVLAAVMTAMGWLLAVASFGLALAPLLTPAGALAVVAALHLVLALVTLGQIRTPRADRRAKPGPDPARPSPAWDLVPVLGLALVLLLQAFPRKEG